jgi:hypothetical protein
MIEIEVEIDTEVPAAEVQVRLRSKQIPSSNLEFTGRLVSMPLCWLDNPGAHARHQRGSSARLTH